MKKFGLIFAVLIFLSMTAFAQDVYNFPSNLDNILNQIPKMGSIKCKFRQEKYLSNISKPIESSGNFEFIENKGVYFDTLYPVKSSINYTNKNYKQINDIVNAIAAKKYSKLEKEFDFYYTGNPKDWILGLKPKKNSDTYNYVSSITIDGADYIKKISIEQTNGNKTLLWFIK